MRRVLPVAARVLLGGMFLVYGLDGFFHFMPAASQPVSREAERFIGGLMASPYFWPMLKACEVAGGALLLSDRFAALGLVVLAPLVVNIAALHFFTNPAGVPFGVAVGGLELLLAWHYRARFRPLFARSGAPAASAVPPAPGWAAHPGVPADA